MSPFQKTKKRALHLSRRARMQKNPIPWILILLISGALFYQIAPDYKEWNQKKAEIKILAPKNIELDKESSELADKKRNLENKFTEAAKKNASLEEQLFPKKIDSSKIAQIFEIYGLLLDPQTQSLKKRRSVFEIKTLAIGNTSPKKNSKYSITPINMNLDIDKNNLKKLLTFLRDNKISDKLRDKIVDQATEGDASINFLENNILPVNTISSLSLDKVDSKDYSYTEIYNVQLQIVLYSQQ